MRALASDTLRSLDDLRATELPSPAPGPGEVRVRVHCSAVNPADRKVLEGSFAGRFLMSRKTPRVPGYDLSGVVDAVGEGADLAVGDAVWGHQQYAPTTEHGCWAELTVIRADAVAKLPPGVDHATAAGAATAGLTSLQALRDVAGFTGGRALVVGAAGGVGSLAVGVAKRLGGEVTAVCGAGTADLVRSLGADRVLERGSPLAGGPFDVIFDSPAVLSCAAVRGLLTPRGSLVTTLPGPDLVLGKLLTLFSGRSCTYVHVESRREDLELLGRWLADGLAVPIESRWPVRDAVRAVEAIASGSRRGRTIIDVEGGW